ncbi:glycosyltransferase family 2 protein [Chloroflexota bacterium]
MKQSANSFKGEKTEIVAAIPAFNEEKYIGTIVLKARQYVDEVIVIDDGSTDQTASVARLAGATVIQHKENKGKGLATQRILLEAKKRNPDVLVFLDADFQHNPDEIIHLIKPVLDGSDLVIGSRQAQASKTPRYRRIGQKILLFSTRVLSGASLSDSESGFKALSRKAISEIQLNENGFAIEAEMIACAVDKNLKITQVPISNIYTKDGSTLNPIRHGFEVLLRILAMISERRPLFFFGLSGIILIVLGLFAGIKVLGIAYGGGELAIGTALISTLLLVIGILSIFTGVILNVLAKRND